MELTFVWDTNIVIYYLQKQFPPAGEQFIDDILITSPPAISVITEIELLCWKTEIESEITILQNFVKDCFVIEIDQMIKLKTAEIRKANRIKLPDAIIAATALTQNLTLLTRNLQDFNNIQNLRCIDPWNK
jgi:hypothetical protein